MSLGIATNGAHSATAPCSHDRSHFSGRALLIALLFAGILFGGLAFKLQSSQATSSKVAPLFSEAIAAQNAGKLNAAAADYHAILKTQPANKLALYDMGTIYEQKGQRLNAYYSYERALLVDPNYVPALFNLAVLETPSNPGPAAEFYQRVEQLNPRNARAFFNLGALEANHGHTLEAKIQYTEAIRLMPSLAASVPASLR